MKIAVMATGGVGGVFGAKLAQAGEDVTFIARGPHLEAIQNNGLTIASDDGTQVLENVQINDDPEAVGMVDVVMFADPKQSQIEIRQVMARAARVAPDKECGYVLVPVGLDEDGPLDVLREVVQFCIENDKELRESFNA